jgi:hypothetical protein
MASHNYLNIAKPRTSKSFINNLVGEFHLLWCTLPRVILCFGSINIILPNVTNVILYMHCISEILVY